VFIISVLSRQGHCRSEDAAERSNLPAPARRLGSAASRVAR